MFELDREVTAWSKAFHAGRCRIGASVAELRDHLYCEIDRARSEGLSDEQAFAAAVARLDPENQLSAEYAKNHSLLGTACAVVARLERSDSRRALRGPLMAHALLWAGMMLAASLLLSKSTTPDALSFLLIGVLVPCWLASEQILRSALKRPPTGRSR